MKLTLILSASILALTVPAIAIPPLPPEGKRWVRNDKFSDEFNADKLDSTKWFDHHPNWKGRPPGIFLPSQVSVGGGYMKITSRTLDKPMVVGKSTFTVAGGAVVSKTTDATTGYYECRFKAAATTMSTTFWLSSRQQFPGPNEGKDSYGLELDIQECIGREGNFKGKYFAKGMHSNGHFWYHDGENKGGAKDLRATEVKFESDQLCSADFNTYGGWWQDESTASFYFNNGEPKHMKFYSKIKEKPFDHPMGLNMVSETYPFPWIELPGAEELNDPSRNTCYYDWVRAYDLVDANTPTRPNGEVVKLYDEEVTLMGQREKSPGSAALSVNFSYKMNKDRVIHLLVTGKGGKRVADSKFQAFAGYANAWHDIPLGAGVEGPYQVKAEISSR